MGEDENIGRGERMIPRQMYDSPTREAGQTKCVGSVSGRAHSHVPGEILALRAQPSKSLAPFKIKASSTKTK